LYHYLSGKVSEFQDDGRGVTQKNLSAMYLRNLHVPLGGIDEHRRIAAILVKADAIRRKRQQALALADDFLKSVFLEMFGDPHRNPHNYPVREFDTLLTIPLRNGISPSSKGAVAAGVLTLSAITGEKFDATQIKEGKFLRPISKTDQVDVGDFYICRGNGSPDLVGKGYFASKSMKGVAFPDTMIAAKINADEICRGFFQVIWNSQFVRGQIIEAARTTNGTFKINQTATGGIRIPTPPKARQEMFEHVFRKVHDVRERLSLEDDLFASLSQRAFRGEL
jgi:type I restriction enzyme S subunit